MAYLPFLLNTALFSLGDSTLATPQPRMPPPSVQAGLSWITASHPQFQGQSDRPIAPSWDNPELFLAIEGESATIHSLAFSPDGRFIALGGGRNDPRIEIWDLQQEKRIRHWNTYQNRVLALAFSPDGNTLVSSSDGGAIEVWDVQEGKLLHRFLEHRSNVLSLAISPDGRNLVSGGLDGIRFWDLLDYQLIQVLLNLQPIYSVAFRGDGQLIAAGTHQGNIILWPVIPGEGTAIVGNPLSTSFQHDRGITTLDFTPDGNRLIAGSFDATIKCWDLVNRELHYSLVDHPSWIKSLKINPNGQLFASASRDGIRFWNIETGEAVGFISAESDWAQAIAWYPDGLTLATGGLDRIVNLWRGGMGPNQDAIASPNP
ncbi:WD40 repeat domain-containing protein [Laspinema sp. A4]|uniref:WD40 repeat domain-containing protein n=1 Tax=Laspinema sp. D2d TaxID=2953686 RepID=UPI0021BAC888|nr:WD40 repeat domain-containing protein [Laspinema sp. D2d]MCT7983678.1 WD40 repeat domain-containing protein [Laspinema sp. D2d]